MNLHSVLQALEASSPGRFIASSTYAFPLLEVVHVISVVAMVGYIVVMDLRLLGLASLADPVRKLARDTLPFACAGFAGAVVSGTLLFIAKAPTYIANPYFIAKLILLVLAGLNIAAFHLVTWRTVPLWDMTASIPLGAKLAGGLSLLFWIAVVFSSRMIGFTLSVFG